MALGQSFRRSSEFPLLSRRRRSSPINAFSMHPPASKPPPNALTPSPGLQSAPIKFKRDLGHPKAVTAPVSSPLQAGLSHIQSQLGENAPTAYNLPKLLDPKAHYLTRDASGRAIRSQRFQLNPQSSRMLGATDAGQVVAPHEVSLLGNAPRRMDQAWYEQWFEEGFCKKSSPEQCDQIKNLKRFYNRPYEKLLAGIPLSRIPEKYDKPFVSTDEIYNRFLKYHEGKYDIDQPSMSKADYMADVKRKLGDPHAYTKMPTREELERMEYNLKMTQRSKQEGWATGKMPIDPSLYAHTEANREAIYEQVPEDKSYADYWDEQHQNKHWWDYLSYLNPVQQGVKALRARANYAGQFGDPAHDLHAKRKFLYEHPGWLKDHPEDKEKYMTGFLGNRLPDSWLGHVGKGIGNFALGLADAVSNPAKAGDAFIQSVSSIPEHVKKECTAPGIDTTSCIRTRQALQPLGLSSMGDAAWQSGSDLDAPIRSEPTLNKALDIGGQSALFIGSAALPALGGAGEGASLAAGVERSLEPAVASGAMEGVERAPMMEKLPPTLGDETLPKTPLPEQEVTESALSTPEQLADNERRMRDLATWESGLTPEQNLARQKSLDSFMVDTDQLRKWQESPGYQEQQPSYFTHARYEAPNIFKKFDKRLMNQQADTLFSDTPEGQAMRMNDRLSIIKSGRKSAPDRYALDQQLGGGTAGSMEKDAINRELMGYAKNLQSFRPEGKLPKPPAYAKATRLLDKARWAQQRVLGKGPAAGMPGKGPFDEWLGPRFLKGEELADWLSQPKAARFYNKYRKQLGMEPQAQKWAKGAQYPELAKEQSIVAPHLEEASSIEPSPITEAKESMVRDKTPYLPRASQRQSMPMKKQAINAAEAITQHLQQPEESRLLATAGAESSAPGPDVRGPSAQAKVMPKTIDLATAETQATGPLSREDFKELQEPPSPLIEGDASSESTPEVLQKLTSDRQRKIDTTHIINNASFSDEYKKDEMMRGKKEAEIRHAEKQSIYSAIRDYELRRMKAEDLLKNKSGSGKKGSGFFRKKTPKLKAESEAPQLLDELRKYQGAAGQLTPRQRIDPYIKSYLDPPIDRFSQARRPIMRKHPRN